MQSIENPIAAAETPTVETEVQPAAQPSDANTIQAQVSEDFAAPHVVPPTDSTMSPPSQMQQYFTQDMAQDQSAFNDQGFPATVGIKEDG